MNKDFTKKISSEKIVLYSVFGIFLLLSLGTFIATSWYSVDFKIADTLDNMLQNDFGRGWAMYILYAGYTMLVGMILVLVSIMAESAMKFINKKWPEGWFKHNSWFINLIYVVLILVWVLYNVFICFTYIFKDFGMGHGINHELMFPVRYTIIIYSMSCAVETAILLVSLWFIKYKLSKSKDFMVNEYWKDAVSGLVFYVVSYIIVLLFKNGFAREYYYDVNAEDILNTLHKDFPEIWEKYMMQDTTNLGLLTPGKTFDPTNPLFINQGFTNIDGDWPWWKPQGFFAGNNKPIDPNLVQKQDAFPSGHVNASYCYVAFLFVFLNKNYKSKKVNNWIKAFIIGCVAWIILTDFGLVIGRGHWMSDVLFTNMWASAAMLIARAIVNGVYGSINKKVKSKTELKKY